MTLGFCEEHINYTREDGNNMSRIRVDYSWWMIGAMQRDDYRNHRCYNSLAHLGLLILCHVIVTYHTLSYNYKYKLWWKLKENVLIYNRIYKSVSFIMAEQQQPLDLLSKWAKWHAITWLNIASYCCSSIFSISQWPWQILDLT